MLRVINKLRNRGARFTVEHNRSRGPLTFFEQRQSRRSIAWQSFGITRRLKRNPTLSQDRLYCLSSVMVILLRKLFRELIANTSKGGVIR